MSDEDVVVDVVMDEPEPRRSLRNQRRTRSKRGGNAPTIDNIEPSDDQGEPFKKKRKVMKRRDKGSKTVGARLKEAASQRAQMEGQEEEVAAPSTSSRPPIHLNADQESTIRVVAQYLKDIGLSDSVAKLAEESGKKFEACNSQQLRLALSHGQWDNALHTIAVAADHLPERMLFAVNEILTEERILDLVHHDKRPLALKVLCSFNGARLTEATCRRLSMFILQNEKTRCLENEWVEYKIYKRKFNRHNVDRMFKRLLSVLPHSFLMPPNRLEHIFMEAWKQQRMQTCFNPHSDPSELLAILEHNCQNHSKNHYYRMHRKKVEEDRPRNRHIQKQEVWTAEFSHDGLRVATGMYCNDVDVWRVCVDGNGFKFLEKHIRLYETAIHPRQMMSDLKWSPDDKIIAASGDGNCPSGPIKSQIYLWDVESGGNIVISNIMDCVWSSLSFIPCYIDRHYTLAAGDMQGSLRLFEVNPVAYSSVRVMQGHRIRMVHALKDGVGVIAVDGHNTVLRFNNTSDLTASPPVEKIFREETAITSMAVHPSEKYIIVNVLLIGLRMWTVKPASIFRTYRDSDHGDRQINIAFGGNNDQFFATGGIDGIVRVYSMTDSDPLALITVSLHKCVNHVSWHPTDPTVIVTGSDDGSVTLWSSRIFDTRRLVNDCERGVAEIDNGRPLRDDDDVPKAFCESDDDEEESMMFSSQERARESFTPEDYLQVYQEAGYRDEQEVAEHRAIKAEMEEALRPAEHLEHEEGEADGSEDEDDEDYFEDEDDEDIGSEESHEEWPEDEHEMEDEEESDQEDADVDVVGGLPETDDEDSENEDPPWGEDEEMQEDEDEMDGNERMEFGGIIRRQERGDSSDSGSGYLGNIERRGQAGI